MFKRQLLCFIICAILSYLIFGSLDAQAGSTIRVSLNSQEMQFQYTLLIDAENAKVLSVDRQKGDDPSTAKTLAPEQYSAVIDKATGSCQVDIKSANGGSLRFAFDTRKQPPTRIVAIANTGKLKNHAFDANVAVLAEDLAHEPAPQPRNERSRDSNVKPDSVFARFSRESRMIESPPQPIAIPSEFEHALRDAGYRVFAWAERPEGKGSILILVDSKESQRRKERIEAERNMTSAEYRMHSAKRMAQLMAADIKPVDAHEIDLFDIENEEDESRFRVFTVEGQPQRELRFQELIFTLQIGFRYSSDKRFDFHSAGFEQHSLAIRLTKSNKIGSIPDPEWVTGYEDLGAFYAEGRVPRAEETYYFRTRNPQVQVNLIDPRLVRGANPKELVRLLRASVKKCEDRLIGKRRRKL